MKFWKIITALLFALFIQSYVQAQSLSSFMPPFTAYEGQLKNSDPPAWQMISMIRIGSESEINPRGNQLLSALINFVNKRGESASSVVLMITAEEKHLELINKVIGVILEEASSRSSAAVVEKLKISVSITDPVTKAERSFELKKKS